MVDIDHDLDNLSKHQRALQGRIEQLEKKSRDDIDPSTDQKALTDLGRRLDALDGEVRRLTGQMDEQKHALGGVSKEIEDRAFHMNEMTERLQAIESRLSAPPPAPQSSEGAQAIPPIVSQTPVTTSPPDDAPSALDAEEEKIVLPGRTVRSKSLSPTETYKLAYNDYLKGNDDLAIIGFQNFMRQYPDSILMPQVIYWTGESYYHKKAYDQAIASFEKLQKIYPKSDKAPSALLKAGLAHLEMGSRSQAKASLKKVIEKFPDSNEAHLAKDKLATLR
jgi:tol-pal system protein YbgF